MSELPREMFDRDFVESFLKKNLKFFYDPRHWRVALKELREVEVQLLSFRPPQFDVLITASVLSRGVKRTFHFYEGVVVEKEPANGSRIYGKAKICGGELYFIDGYTSRGYLKNLLEAWCREEELDSIGFVGSFLGLKGDVEVEIEKLVQLYKAGVEPSTNHLYRCSGLAKSAEGEKRFDVVIKRFLPREPAGRGNREYSMLKALPANIVPKVHGGLVNHALAVNGGPQLLVIFADFIDGVEVGEEVWEVMEEIGRSGKSDVSREKSLEQLMRIAGEVVDKVVFPFHRSSFEAWHAPGRTLRAGDEFQQWYFKELRENLDTVKDAGLITGEEEKVFWAAFSTAWDKVLKDVRATEIHGDLMWRQILRTRSGELVIFDLDDHAMGHAGKDLADLYAAGRFIAEELPCRDKTLVRSAAESLGQFMVEEYIKNAELVGAEWAEMLEKTVLIYLAHRHLHDAAYYTPAWLETTDEQQKLRYKKYVDFSISRLRRSMDRLKAFLEGFGD